MPQRADFCAPVEPMAKLKSGERRQDILQTLARLLQERPGEPITTAVLAQAVGVSEAALYRHFPSKAKMFEALIEFAENTVFTRINRIVEETPHAEARLQQVALLVLGFAEKNPGIAAVLQGNALTGETVALQLRVAQFFDRIETQMRQMLREGETHGAALMPADVASVVLAMIEGRIAQAVRTRFRVPPTTGFETQWPPLARALFKFPT